MRKLYSYHWDNGILIVKIKRGRSILFQVGNSRMAISLRRPPKKIALAVTGKATAKKGLLPNSIFNLEAEWYWEINSILKEEKIIVDDEYTQGTFTFLKANVYDSKNIKYNSFTPDGATFLNEDQVQKIFF